MRSLVTVLFLLCLSLAARADHEPDHRYEVQGYLLDAQRQPLPGAGISISSGNQILGSARSDSDGFYYMKLHLHDSSIGRPLVLSTAEYSGTITMIASSGDVSTRRLHFANFIDGKLVEGELEGLGNTRWMVYTGAALVVAIIIAVAIGAAKRRRKRRRRQSQKTSNGKRRQRRKR